MPTRTRPRRPRATLVEAVAEAKAILARAQVLDDLPWGQREALLWEPEGAVYQADRDVALVLLARFVAVIEQTDPDVALASVALVRLDLAVAQARR